MNGTYEGKATEYYNIWVWERDIGNVESANISRIGRAEGLSLDMDRTTIIPLRTIDLKLTGVYEKTRPALVERAIQAIERSGFVGQDANGIRWIESEEIMREFPYHSAKVELFQVTFEPGYNPFHIR